MLERAADLYERAPRRADGADHPRRRPDDPGGAVRGARGGRFPALLRGRARAPISPTPNALPGPTGERNELALHGRGVFACISPWNFPLAIFTGQIAAALAAGNAVIAKPAEQTPLIAAAAVRLLLAAGIPGDVLHLLPGDRRGGRRARWSPIRASPASPSPARPRPRARSTSRWRARAGPIVPFIAETGGQNAMIVDSSALPEQVVADVLTSAFDSAGQRCSALRLLYRAGRHRRPAAARC